MTAKLRQHRCSLLTVLEARNPERVLRDYNRGVGRAALFLGPSVPRFRLLEANSLVVRHSALCSLLPSLSLTLTRLPSKDHPPFFFLMASCRILVLQPGIEPATPEVEVQSLHPWTTREVPKGPLDYTEPHL